MGKPVGTLIVVVLKARNLPNKQRIGKQDPYATCTYLSHRKRTKTDKRGGQHPVWDDELRFDIYGSLSDVQPITSISTTSTGGVAPIKTGKPSTGAAEATNDGTLGAGEVWGVKGMKVAVYADDPRDPELIGEGRVDLSETLKKGEFDDWVPITNKGKYQGEVYLEMTFYSAKPPPEKKTGPAFTRAGVFEATSPATALRQTNKHGSPKTSSKPITMPVPSSPTTTPTKPHSHTHHHPIRAQSLDLENVPSSLRVAGGSSPPKPRTTSPSPGLPLPGDPPDPSTHHQRRTSHGQQVQMPMRPPSRVQSADDVGGGAPGLAHAFQGFRIGSGEMGLPLPATMDGNGNGNGGMQGGGSYHLSQSQQHPPQQQQSQQHHTLPHRHSVGSFAYPENQPPLSNQQQPQQPQGRTGTTIRLNRDRDRDRDRG